MTLTDLRFEATPNYGPGIGAEKVAGRVWGRISGYQYGGGGLSDRVSIAPKQSDSSSAVVQSDGTFVRQMVLDRGEALTVEYGGESRTWTPDYPPVSTSTDTSDAATDSADEGPELVTGPRAPAGTREVVIDGAYGVGQTARYAVEASAILGGYSLDGTDLLGVDRGDGSASGEIGSGTDVWYVQGDTVEVTAVSGGSFLVREKGGASETISKGQAARFDGDGRLFVDGERQDTTTNSGPTYGAGGRRVDPPTDPDPSNSSDPDPSPDPEPQPDTDPDPQTDGGQSAVKAPTVPDPAPEPAPSPPPAPEPTAQPQQTTQTTASGPLAFIVTVVGAIVDALKQVIA